MAWTAAIAFEVDQESAPLIDAHEATGAHGESARGPSQLQGADFAHRIPMMSAPAP